MTRILITGGSGYIGSHVVKQFLMNGFIVNTTVRDPKNPVKCGPLFEICKSVNVDESNLKLYKANLLEQEGWEEAMEDCSVVLHTASPFPLTQPKHEDELIKPAVEGTLNVLKACAKQPGIKKVVLTSSAAAIFSGADSFVDIKANETMWTDTTKKGVNFYVKSKTLAEKAAWDFVETRKSETGSCFDLVVINPTFVMGPALIKSLSTSMNFFQQVLENKIPLLPKLMLPFCDVRDVANAHYIAATNDDIKNRRYLIATRSLWMNEMGIILKKEFSNQGYKIPTNFAPNFLLWLASFINTEVKAMVPFLDVEVHVDNTRMVSELGIVPTTVEKSLIDMAYAGIENGIFKKTSGYTGRVSEL